MRSPTAPTVAPDPQREADARAGKALMIGLLVLFFGMAFTANGLIVYMSSRSPNPIVESYTTERR
ncbi:MAG: hypothetical protein JNM72_05460 [Deltaproteobacteria bacterium]|jgi:hypothetical protein|nr:hypothetical protein [Deltaproteobacteria bacterium]